MTKADYILEKLAAYTPNVPLTAPAPMTAPAAKGEWRDTPRNASNPIQLAGTTTTATAGTRGDAFKAARDSQVKQGLDPNKGTFSYGGKSYNTRMAGPSKAVDPRISNPAPMAKMTPMGTQVNPTTQPDLSAKVPTRPQPAVSVAESGKLPQKAVPVTTTNTQNENARQSRIVGQKKAVDATIQKGKKLDPADVFGAMDKVESTDFNSLGKSVQN